MTTIPLTRHRRFATSDVDEARDEVARAFCPHGLTPTRRGGRLDMLHNAARIGRDVTLNYLRYGDEVRITPGTFDTFFLAQIPLTGTARVKVGDRVVASDRSRATIGSPTEPVDMIWSADCEQLLVHVRREAVEEVAGTGGEPVVFAPMLDLATPAVRSWLRLVKLAVDDLEAGGALFRSSLAATSFEQALIAGLLGTQPNSSSTTTTDDPVVVGSRTVRTATAAIEAEPERPWRLAEIARAAGVSPRTLQEAFQRELDVSPLGYVRRVRLERARQDLLAAEPATASVTDVAARWGFFHLGRFSQSYRDAFQELPSQTLAC